MSMFDKIKGMMGVPDDDDYDDDDMGFRHDDSAFDEQNVADDLEGYSMEDENGDPLLEEDSYTDDDFSFDDSGDDDLL